MKVAAGPAFRPGRLPFVAQFVSMEIMQITTRLVVVTAALAASGCYKQEPLRTVPPTPATRIVATLTDSGTVAMGNAIGAGALAVEGVITAANDREWTMQMIRVEHRDGRAIDWNREVVRFPSNVLSEPAVKILDKKRSWMAAGAITIGAFLAARAFNLLGADEAGDDTPVPAETVIPFGGR